MTVYRLTNLINAKVYIGQTIRPVAERWAQHCADRNKFDYPLYRAIKKYGKESFKIETIDRADDIDSLNKKETEAIGKARSTERAFGYNILAGGNNYIMPQAIKDKISKAMKGRKFTSHLGKEKRGQIARANALCRIDISFTVMDQDNNLLYEGSILSDCSRELNIPVSSIHKWVTGMRKSKNYKVFLKEEN